LLSVQLIRFGDPEMASKCIQALIQAYFLWSGIAIAQREGGKMKDDNEYVSKLARTSRQQTHFNFKKTLPGKHNSPVK
jgi:hypothetical protein